MPACKCLGAGSWNGSSSCGVRYGHVLGEDIKDVTRETLRPWRQRELWLNVIHQVYTVFWFWDSPNGAGVTQWSPRHEVPALTWLKGRLETEEVVSGARALKQWSFKISSFSISPFFLLLSSHPLRLFLFLSSSSALPCKGFFPKLNSDKLVY